MDSHRQPVYKKKKYFTAVWIWDPNPNNVMFQNTSNIKICGTSVIKPHTYLLTPWCRVLLEKLTGLQLVKKFPAFYGTRRFITALTSVRHLSLSWASPIQSTFPHPISWRSILILSTHLRLGLPSGLFCYFRYNLVFLVLLISEKPKPRILTFLRRQLHVRFGYVGILKASMKYKLNLMTSWNCCTYTTE